MNQQPSLKARPRAGTLQTQRGLKALSPDWFSVEERSSRDWLIYLKRFSQWMNFHTATGESDRDWSSFFPDEAAFDELLLWLEQGEAAGSRVSAETQALAARPDMALLLSFLRIMRHPQEQFRRLTDRHMTHYYQDVLGLTNRPAEPDQLHILATLTAEAKPLVLPAGTQFDAGVDSEGNPRYYRLDDSAGLNHAGIQTVRSLSLSRSGNNVGFLRTNLIDHDSGLVFPEAGSLTFGETTQSDAERQKHPNIGLVLGSPLLWLSEGKRIISLKFDSEFARSVELQELSKPFQDHFNVSISTEEGMQQLDDDRLATVALINTSDSFSLVITLEKLFPAVTPPPAPVHAQLKTPYLQLDVKSDSDKRLEAYEKLRRINLDNLVLNVEVQGLSQLLVRNDLSQVDPAGPFQPFGGQPRMGSRMQFSHAELAIKSLQSLKLNMQWSGRPENMADYYQPYETYLRSQPGKGSIEWPVHEVKFGSPHNQTEESLLFDQELIRTTDGLFNSLGNLYPDGLEWSDYSELPLSSGEPRQWPFWYSLTLSQDDFGHSLYNSVTSWHNSEYTRSYQSYTQRHTTWQNNKNAHDQAVQTYNEQYGEYLVLKNQYDNDQADYLQKLAANQAVQWFTIVARSHTGSGSPRSRGIYNRNGSRLYDPGSSFAVAVWNNATRSWYSHTQFNIEGDSAQAEAMANHLSSISSSMTVVVYTGDRGDSLSSQNNRLQGGLKDVILSYGGTSQGFDDDFPLHGGYILIGRNGLGAGNGYEAYSSSSDTSSSWVLATVEIGSSGALNYNNVSTGLQPVTPLPEVPPAPVAPTPPNNPGVFSEPEPVAPGLSEVKRPWTPLVDSFSVDYIAEQLIAVQQAGTGAVHQLLHVHPVGCQAVKDAEKQTLLPALERHGYLYIGISTPPSGGSINLLFQLAPVDSDPSLASASVQWSYLANNRWVPFAIDNQDEAVDRALILSDDTNNLVDSGIIRFGMDPAMTRDGGFPGDKQVWLRASLDTGGENSKAANWSRLQGIHSQAMVARFDDSVSAPIHLPSALPAESVAGLLESSVTPEAFGAIDTVLQPYPSFRGRPPEEVSFFNMRVSERLRHRGRAVTAWDYEHLVLDQFPDIVLANCQRDPDKAGGICLFVVPRTNDPAILKPRVQRNVQQQVEDYLKPLMPPSASLNVKSPAFQEVRFDIALTFHPQYDPGLVLQTLNDDLVAMLSPWAGIQKGGELKSEIYTSDIVAFVAQQPYVELVLNVNVDTLLPQSATAEWTRVRDEVITPAREDVILVPAARHSLRALATGSQVYEGISLMQIDYDFVIEDAEILEGIGVMTIQPEDSETPPFEIVA